MYLARSILFQAPRGATPGSRAASRVRNELERILMARAPDALWPRWIFLRALGLIFFSAFYSLAFQIHGLIGRRGILPVAEYLGRVSAVVPGIKRLWYVPSVLWLGTSDRALTAVVALGIVCSLLVVVNV